MRYYTIEISDQISGTIIRRFTSLSVQGVTDLGALNVELDIPVFPYAQPIGGAFIRVWGVSLQTISQASDFNGRAFKIFGGMAKGLPLANPQQSGLLAQGFIQQAFGNWQDTNQTLDMVVQAGTGTVDAPANLILNWRKGQALSEAIQNTLNTAYPGYTVKVNISSRLVLDYDQVAYYQTISEFAGNLRVITQAILGGEYRGVEIILREKQFIVYDGTSPTTPKQIKFTDLIGQPTWINPGQIQIKAVMRADVSLGDYVKLPPGQILTTAQSYSQYKQGSVFQGTFQIDSVRHLGNFRQPDANSWVTVFDMHQVAQQTGTTQ